MIFNDVRRLDNVWDTWPQGHSHKFWEDWDKEGHIYHPKRSSQPVTAQELMSRRHALRCPQTELTPHKLHNALLTHLADVDLPCVLNFLLFFLDAPRALSQVTRGNSEKRQNAKLYSCKSNSKSYHTTKRKWYQAACEKKICTTRRTYSQ